MPVFAVGEVTLVYQDFLIAGHFPHEKLTFCVNLSLVLSPFEDTAYAILTKGATKGDMLSTYGIGTYIKRRKSDSPNGQSWVQRDLSSSARTSCPSYVRYVAFPLTLAPGPPPRSPSGPLGPTSAKPIFGQRSDVRGSRIAILWKIFPRRLRLLLPETNWN